MSALVTRISSIELTAQAAVDLSPGTGVADTPQNRRLEVVFLKAERQRDRSPLTNRHDDYSELR